MIVDLLDLGGALLFVAVLVVTVFFVRHLLVRRGGASLDCAVRHGSAVGSRSARGWHFGMARYTASHLQWFRVMSLSLQPRVTLARRSMRVVGRRDPHNAELIAVPRESLIVRCTATTRGGRPLDVEFAMTEAAMTGFLAWMESAPPGAHQGSDARRY